MVSHLRLACFHQSSSESWKQLNIQIVSMSDESDIKHEFVF